MDAVETLLRRDGRALLTIARCWLGSGPAALEAVADAVAVVGCRRGSVIDGPALRTAVLTAAIDRLAGVPPCDEQSLGDLLPVYDAEGTRVAPDREDGSVETAAGSAVMRAAICRVPVPFRQPLLLVDMEGWRFNEAAAALGVTVPVLKRRLHIARMALMTLVQRQGQPAVAAA